MRQIRNIASIIFICLLSISMSNLAASAREMPDSFADLAEKLMPAVVNVSTTQTVDQPSRTDNVPPAFEDFFEDFMKKFPRENNRPRKSSSLGSGFVINPDGVIITNNHVVEGADEIVVTFPDGKKFDATLVGRDAKTDLAVLKIESKKKLPFVKLGTSSKSRVGDWVIAIGNPFGLGGSLSVGVISAINRDINSGPYDSFIQTDAAINRGNSGGPLFNMDGEVIGVNSAIISPTGGSVGIGFSIPSDIVETVAGQLQKFGETRRGWLGVRIQVVTDELAETLGLDEAHGALISEVSEEGPALKAGIKAGDVIVKFDGKKIDQMRDLPRIVAETEIDKKVPVEIVRRGKRRTVQVVTGRLDEAVVASADGRPNNTTKNPAISNVAGISLEDLDATARKELGLSADVKGAIVSKVDVESLAYESGIRRGNVITEVAQSPVKSAKETKRAIEKAIKSGDKSVLLLLKSAQGLRFVALKLKDD